jgi:hypothetical protein
MGAQIQQSTGRVAKAMVMKLVQEFRFDAADADILRSLLAGATVQQRIPRGAKE